MTKISGTETKKLAMEIANNEGLKVSLAITTGEIMADKTDAMEILSSLQAIYTMGYMKGKGLEMKKGELDKETKRIKEQQRKQVK